MIDSLTEKGRQAMYKFAVWLDKVSRSQVTPNFVTLLSFIGHISVFTALVGGRFPLAAFLIAFFGLMDALDGALARVQGKSSPVGMLLDASSDRAKEFLIYWGLILFFFAGENIAGIMAATAALGGSFMVSYIKAKGETAIATTSDDHTKVNRKFSNGLMQYQVRMFVLIVGLLVGDHMTLTVTLIALLSWITALIRLIDIVEVIQASTDKK